MVVVITGASAGIGRALAVDLSKRGAKLVLSARRVELLDQLNQQLGGEHLVLRTNVANRADCEALIDQSITRFGRIDTLVCNAGYGMSIRVHEMSAEQMQAMFQTNVY